MRYFLFMLLLACPGLCYGLSSLQKAGFSGKVIHMTGATDSLSLTRRVKRKHHDSVLRIHQRDSLRAGYFIHFKGAVVSIQTLRGEQLVDSLAHPYRVAREQKRKKYIADSIGMADSARKGISRIPLFRDSMGIAGVPASLKPVSAADSLRARTDRILKYYQAHKHLDSIPEQIAAATIIHKNLFPDIDKHRPLAKRGTNRHLRESWIISVLLLVLIILATVKVRFPKDMNDVFKGLFNDRMIREINLVNSPSFIFMFLVFCLTAALVLYEYLNFLHLNENYEGVNLYLILLLSIVGFFIFKLISYQLSAVIFKIERMVHPFVSFLYITIANFTLVCIPFLLVFCFYNASLLPHLVTWIPFLFLAFLLFLYIRSIVFFITNFEFPKFYLFLYFCTLEICPLIIVFKLIKG